MFLLGYVVAVHVQWRISMTENEFTDLLLQHKIIDVQLSHDYFIIYLDNGVEIESSAIRTKNVIHEIGNITNE